MNTPKKLGKTYIKFDDKNQPEYEFVVFGNNIQKFIPLTNNDSTNLSIVLPKLVESAKPEVTTIDETIPYTTYSYMEKQNLKNYIVGKVKISDGCFEGIKKARIIVPFENSIMLDYGSFDEGADIELVLPGNLDLKLICRRTNTGSGYERKEWILICDKNTAGPFNIGIDGPDEFLIVDYNPTDSNKRIANFKITHLEELQNEEDLIK